MSQRLFVGSLSFDTADADLKEFFSQAGTCESASVIRDRESGRSRGFGFVVMASEEEARRAIAELDGKELQGRRIHVSEARERSATRSPRPPFTPRGPLPPRGFHNLPMDDPPEFRKSKGSRRGLRGRKRSL